MMPSLKILSLDGGGIRGVLSAAFLAHVEDELGAPLVEQFDLVTGTSTGAIIALALSIGMSAREVLNAYKKAGPLIFPETASLWSRLWSPGHQSGPLLTWLKQVFGEKTLSEAKLKVVIPTLDVGTGAIRVWKTDHHAELHGGGQKLMREVAMASAAAPTYLQAVQIEGKGAYVDGGLWANNPAMLGVVEAIRYGGSTLDEITCLSVGTGKRPRADRFEDVQRRGIVGWSGSLVEVVFAAQSAAADNQARLLLGDERYLRVNPDLSRAIELDDVSEISELEHLGESAGLAHLNGVRRLLELPAKSAAGL